jgi:hypothetical protein
MGVKPKQSRKPYPRYPKVLTEELWAAWRALRRAIPDPKERSEILKRWKRRQMQHIARVGLTVVPKAILDAHPLTPRERAQLEGFLQSQRRRARTERPVPDIEPIAPEYLFALVQLSMARAKLARYVAPGGAVDYLSAPVVQARQQELGKRPKKSLEKRRESTNYGAIGDALKARDYWNLEWGNKKGALDKVADSFNVSKRTVSTAVHMFDPRRKKKG